MQATTKIVILDGFTANPGDVAWDAIAEQGDLAVHDRSTADEARERVAGATAVLTNKVAIDDSLLAANESIRYVGVLATGVNVVDLDACRKRGVTVTNIPGYSTESTAQHAFALLLELTNRVGQHARDVAERWPASADFSYTVGPLTELAGLTCGVIGFGAIGQAFCRRARAFGMKVVAHTANPHKHHDAAALAGIELVGRDELLRQSDVVSLHCPLTHDTRHLVNADTLAKMKRGTFLVNASRGPLLDAAAVAAALAEGRLAGVAVDVLDREPPPADDPLLRADNCIVTPHIAWATRAARSRSIAIAADNLRAFLRGEPQNVVS